MLVKQVFLTIVAIVTVCVCSITQAQTVTLNVNASVPESLELSYWIRWAEPGQDPYEYGHSGDATALDFGTLEWNSSLGMWTASRYFTVFLVARTSGRPYQIKQTCTGLVSGTDNLNESFVMTPDYIPEDEFQWPGGSAAQGPIPDGDSYGKADIAWGSGKIVYDSNSGKSRIVRVYYGLATGEPGKPGKPITGDYPAGNYTGTVVFTLTLKQ